MAVGALLLSGCAQKKAAVGTEPAAVASSAQKPAKRSAKQSKVIVTPSHALAGRVALVNPTARHVILTFPMGLMPSVEQRLAVYRNGLKVGEVKVTGPQQDTHIAADILAGECRPGDEARTE
jgi:hypothetical protein